MEGAQPPSTCSADAPIPRSPMSSVLVYLSMICPLIFAFVGALVQGQQDVAVRYVQGLLGGMAHHPQRHSALQRAYLQCLAAKWLSRTR